MQRPTCAYCGKPLPKDTDRHYFKPGTEPATRADAQRAINGAIVSVHWGKASRYLTKGEIDAHNAAYPALNLKGPATMTDETRPEPVITSCGVWTGGYRGYTNEFCTIRCAAAFGVASHRAGYRVTK